jgi:hypothetical protein
VGLSRGTPLTVSSCGGYAARLVNGGDGWYPERWTLDGPEPYAVPLPGGQPEDPESEVLPLSDGRVLIARPAGDRWHFALLYPSGPRTGEQPLGAVDCRRRLRLLPPAPGGQRVYALITEEPGEDGESVTALWLVCGGAFGPELVTRLVGGCAGGAWLDGAGRLLALNRTDGAGRVRAVTVDVEGGGPPGVLLQIGEQSNDRLLLADADSGLLLVASDAPGEERIGWGVLGSHRPVRFPEVLRTETPRAAAAFGPAGPADGGSDGAGGGGTTLRMNVSPLAVQPGRTLLPESCGVALRMTAPAREWVAVWRPQQREFQHFAAPDGWLPEATRWTADGQLLLPYATGGTPCGLARLDVPVPAPRPLKPGTAAPPRQPAGERLADGPPLASPATPAPPPVPAESAVRCKPVPLQQAPLP